MYFSIHHRYLLYQPTHLLLVYTPNPSARLPRARYTNDAKRFSLTKKDIMFPLGVLILPPLGDLTLTLSLVGPVVYAPLNRLVVWHGVVMAWWLIICAF